MVGLYRLRTNDPDFSPVYALAWSPDGRLLAASGLYFGLEIHDLESGQARTFDAATNDNAIRHLAWAPDGRLLASVQGARVRLVNPNDGQARTIIEGHPNCCSLAWAADGSLLAAASDSRVVHIWSAQTDKALLLARTRSAVTQLRFEDDDRFLCAVDDGGGSGSRRQAYIWKLRNLQTRKLRPELERIERTFGPAAVGHAPPAAPDADIGEVRTTAAPPPAPRKSSAAARVSPATQRETPPAAPEPAPPAPVMTWIDAAMRAGSSVPASDERLKRGTQLFERASALVENSPAEALRLYEEQEPLWRDLGDRRGLGSCLHGMVVALAAAGRYRDALTRLDEVEKIWRDFGQGDRLAGALGIRGQIHGLLEQRSLALAAYREEETYWRGRGEKKPLARNLAEQARLLAAQKDWSGVLPRLQEEERLLDPVQDRAFLAHNLGFQGWAHAARREQRETVAALARQEAVLRDMADRGRLADGLLRQVELLLMVGEPALAYERAAESASIFAALDRTVDEARARALMLKARMGRPTVLKSLAVVLAIVAPAAIGIALGLWSPWLWLIGAPLVLLSLFMVVTGLSPRLREAVERMASK
jgi:hypothetical protein